MDIRKFNIGIGTALLWTVFYFGVMLFYTLLDITVWRPVFPMISRWLNLAAMAASTAGFLWLLRARTGYRLQILSGVSAGGVLLAVLCAVSFFVLLDHFLDPVFESLFPMSEEAYQESVQTLTASPATGFLQVCVIAPFTEEILMRGFVLGGLRNNCGTWAALMFSAFLFALLHFNMVQTLSAFACGMILGLLYVKTDSILCCIIAHSGYNLISYIALLRLAFMNS